MCLAVLVGRSVDDARASPLPTPYCQADAVRKSPPFVISPPPRIKCLFRMRALGAMQALKFCWVEP